jgi:hypothetical protein
MSNQSRWDTGSPAALLYAKKKPRSYRRRGSSSSTVDASDTTMRTRRLCGGAARTAVPAAVAEFKIGPAKVSDRLITTQFRNTIKARFSEIGKSNVAVCLPPGTEMSFEREVERADHVSTFVLQVKREDNRSKTRALPTNKHGQSVHSPRRTRIS